MNNCDQDYVSLAKYLFGASVALPLIQWARQLWYGERPETVKQVQEISKYAYEVRSPELPPTYIEKPSLLISKVRSGGPPWQTFPQGVDRYGIERLYDVSVRDGLPPTEKNILCPGVTRAQLRIMRDFLYQTERARYTRNGNNAGWYLTKQGKSDVRFWALRLNGMIPTTPPPRRIPRGEPPTS